MTAVESFSNHFEVKIEILLNIKWVGSASAMKTPRQADV